MKGTGAYFKPSYSIGQGYQLDRQTPRNFQNNTSAMRKMLLTSGINIIVSFVNLIKILLFFFHVIPPGGLINPD